MEQETERRLVASCRAGDRGAFDVLFEAHRDRMYRLAWRLTGAHFDADDVVQNAWLRAFRGISQFDGRARFATWLSRILIRAAADHEQRRKRRRAAVKGLDSAEHSEAQARSLPPERAAANELSAALQEAMKALPLQQRSALVLVAFEGVSYAEAAQIQQCAEGTLAWRVAEARKRLCQQLAPYLR